MINSRNTFLTDEQYRIVVAIFGMALVFGLSYSAITFVQFIFQPN